MNHSDLHPLLDLSIQTALKAGAFLKAGMEKTKVINFESERDVKLQSDIDSEHLIREAFGKNTPSFPIIGEEEGGDPATLDGDAPIWVIDPLDGTFNYLRNIPLCCVSIGLMYKKEPVLGVIYNFNDNTLYTGSTHHPFAINNQAVKPKWADSITSACLLTGFPTNKEIDEDSLTEYFKAIRTFKKVRMIGTAALAMAYVAAGHGDVYFEESTNLWDIAAGAALAHSAGGFYSLRNIGKKNTFSCDISTAARKDWLL